MTTKVNAPTHRTLAISPCSRARVNMRRATNAVANVRVIFGVTSISTTSQGSSATVRRVNTSEPKNANALVIRSDATSNVPVNAWWEVTYPINTQAATRIAASNTVRA